AFERVTLEVKHFERLQVGLALEQRDDGRGQIRQIRPSVAHIAAPWISHRAHRATRLHEALTEPTVAARARSEKVARAYDQHRHAGTRRLTQTLFHRNPDLTLASDGPLRR